MSERPLKVALLGCGVVGSEVARLMTTTAADLAARVGAPLELAGVADALDEATALGYAEADPTADVEGFDAAAKAAILASLAFHTRVTGADVYREGITEVTAADIASARELGCVVKLLAICELDPISEAVTARVHPAMIPRSHPLAGAREAYNARLVESGAAGQPMF